MRKFLPKLWQFFSVVLLFTIYYLIFNIPVHAACSPPSDYSTCQVAQTGPFIATNTDPKNYEQIRTQYNLANPTISSQQIPVTVMYSTADLANTDWLKSNLEAMQEYGLYPIIRVSSSNYGSSGWGTISTAEAQISARNLNLVLSQVSFSQEPTVYFGNEPNLPTEWGGMSGQAAAQSYAQAFAAFILAAGTDPAFQVYLPPMAGHQGGYEYQFANWILNYQLSDGRTIAQAIDGAALALYGPNAQELSSLYQEAIQKYSGIDNFVIAEFGPWFAGKLLVSPSDLPLWKQTMSQVFAAIKANPELFAGVGTITTAFFLPDRVLLVVIDENGNVTVIELLTLGGGYLNLLKTFYPLADGDWFKMKLGPIAGEHDTIPEDRLPEVAIDPRAGHEPEHYNDLVRLTKLLAGTDMENEQTLEDYGVWERLRLPEEAKTKPQDKFPEKTGLNLRTDFDCVGAEEGNSNVGLEPNLGQTQGVLADLTQRLARIGGLVTTLWKQEYEIENKECVRRAQGLEGERRVSSATGTAKILSTTGYDGFYKAVKEYKCTQGLWGEEYCWWETTFYLLVQPKTLSDTTTAQIPELSYTYSQKRVGSSAIEKFGGGVFRIFFPPDMEKMGETEGKLYRGEPIHGKGIQDYYSPNGWETFWNPEITDEQAAKDSTGGIPTENVPDDAYGLGGTKAAWDFVQRALTPLRSVP